MPASDLAAHCHHSLELTTPTYYAGMLDAPSSVLPDAPTAALAEENPLTAEDREAAAVRERFLANLDGESMFLDDLAGEAEAAAAERRRLQREREKREYGSGLIDVGGSDADEADVDIDEANVRRGSRPGGDRAAAGAVEDKDAAPAALGPPGSLPLGQVKKQQQEQAGGGLGDLGDVWGDLGLERPEGAPDPGAGDAVAAAGAEPVEDAFAAFEELDPFAGFADLTGGDGSAQEGAGDVMSAGASINPQADAEARAGTGGAADKSVDAHALDALSGDAASAASAVTAARASSSEQPMREGTPQSAAQQQQQGAAEQSADSQAQAQAQAQGVGQSHDAQAAQQQQQQQQQAASLQHTDPTRLPGFAEGVQAMFAGQWQVASTYFGYALSACLEGGNAQLRCTLAQYAACVGLLEGYAATDERGAARLSRYAASLPMLLLDHLSFLVNDAVSRNERAGNYDWCRNILQWLGETFVASGRPDYAQGAHARRQQIYGYGNATVGQSESAAAVVARLDAASAMREIGGVVAQIKAGTL